MAPYIFMGARFDSHHRHPRDPSRDFASQEVLESSSRWRIFGSFRGHEKQASEVMEREAQPLRHAVRERTMVGWSSDELPNHSKSNGRLDELETIMNSDAINSY